jgi:hypothetical protein
MFITNNINVIFMAEKYVVFPVLSEKHSMLELPTTAWLAVGDSNQYRGGH